MELINNFIVFSKYILDLISIIKYIIYIVLLLVFIHVLMFLLKDKKHLNAVRKNPDPELITLKELNETPLVNIVIPAWKEGEEFRDCLESILKLKYPHLKIIVNAGGNEETINIANSYSKYNNFVILRQESGIDKIARGIGKIKALNQCLDNITEGISFLTDADCYFTDELLLRMIHPIVNYNENVVIGAGTRPLKSIENKDLVKYLHFSRLGLSRVKFTRYNETLIGGASTCVSFKVLKSIGKFDEDRFVAEDVSRGQDILSKGFKIYNLSDYRSRMYSNYPKTIKSLMIQRKRYFENTIKNSILFNKKLPIIKIGVLICVSIYFIVLPLLLLIHFGLFLIGVYIFIYLYLKKIRKFIFFKIIADKEYYTKFRKILFIKIIFYLYLEIISSISTLFSLRSLIKNLKKYKAKKQT